MTRPSVLLGVAGLLSVVALAFGCHVETNRERARYALRASDIKMLLYSIETYEVEAGRLPRTLEELQEGNAELRTMDMTPYAYSPEGLAVGDGTRWLVWTHDPLNEGKLIVGRLPCEIASKAPGEKAL